MAAIESLSVQQLKAYIAGAGLSSNDCLEKHELRARAVEAYTRMEQCLPGFRRSRCSRACCVKQRRADSADEDEAVDEPTTIKKPRVSADDFLFASPPPPPAELVAAKKAAKERTQRSQPQHRSSRWTGRGRGRETNALRHQVSLSETYDAQVDDARLARELWVATEKYDGIRAVWWPDGPDPPGFKGRNGDYINRPPASLMALLPRDMRLDGELWAGRGCTFDNVASLIGTRSLEGGRFHEAAWHSVTFVVFDAPFAGGGYIERLEKARARLASVIGPRVRVATPLPCTSAAEKDALLRRVKDAGGEGLVLRRAAAAWRCGSEGRDLLKVKDWLDAEAEVLEYRPALAALPGRDAHLPSLLCRALTLDVPTRDFEAAWSRERAPPAKGTVVTFRYRQVQANGSVSNPQIVNVHQDACECHVCCP